MVDVRKGKQEIRGISQWSEWHCSPARDWNRGTPSDSGQWRRTNFQCFNQPFFYGWVMNG
jgi:hypothetical protein